MPKTGDERLSHEDHRSIQLGAGAHFSTKLYSPGRDSVGDSIRGLIRLLVFLLDVMLAFV